MSWGCASSTWLSIDILVDTVPPVLAVETDPEVPDGLDGWFVTSPEVGLTADEEVFDRMYWYDSDEEMISSFSEPFLLDEGIHNLTFSARDLAEHLGGVCHNLATLQAESLLLTVRSELGSR